MKPVERRMLSFFCETVGKEKRIDELAKAIEVSTSTVKRYARAFERVGLIEIGKVNGKNIVFCKNVCFALVKIKERAIELSALVLSSKRVCSVILPYNAALTQEDNAICAKRACENLCAQTRAERTLAVIALRYGSCIDESVCKEVFSNAAACSFEDKMSDNDKAKARDIAVMDDISALAVDMIRKNTQSKERLT